MRTPADVLAELLASDPARPRLTFYDDTPGPTRGERIELSAKVLANWVAKAANALTDEFDLGPGDTLALTLPPAHWRSAYWALATWSVGATLRLDADGPYDVLVTDNATSGTTDDGDLVVVTLPALARAHPGPLPPGSMDEARELATYADTFVPSQEPTADQDALVRGGEHTTYDAVVAKRDWPAGVRVALGDGDGAEVLRDALSAWALDGSIVLVCNPEAASMPERFRAEGVSLDRTATPPA